MRAFFSIALSGAMVVTSPATRSTFLSCTTNNSNSNSDHSNSNHRNSNHSNSNTNTSTSENTSTSSGGRIRKENSNNEHDNEHEHETERCYLGHGQFVRTYESEIDFEELTEMCKTVWDGTDYLPHRAASYEADPSCDFLIVRRRSLAKNENENENENRKGTDVRVHQGDAVEEGEMLAAGNRRIFDYASSLSPSPPPHNKNKSIAWLEAIRTSPLHSGKGIATSLMQHMIQRAREDGMQQILTCTIESNHAMKKVFGKVGVEMEFYKKIWFVDFSKLVPLPGWIVKINACNDGNDKHDDGNDDDNEDDVCNANDNDEVEVAQNLLQALHIDHLINDQTKADVHANAWETITTQEELQMLLCQVKLQGGIGYLPGIGKLLWPDQYMANSLSLGLIRKLTSKNTSKNNSNTNTNTNTNTSINNEDTVSGGDDDDTDDDSRETVAVYGLIREPSITSLKSKYVCCIAATNESHFESALWDACSEEMVSLRGEDGAAFALVFDGAIVTRSDMAMIKQDGKDESKNGDENSRENIGDDENNNKDDDGDDDRRSSNTVLASLPLSPFLIYSRSL
mmetsp:Transcript_18311/g.26976  ORF Transcript_18311/g.26976 Transcript_18311/m.26976 type:complete len:569 (+) Transcript_18311:116-1822(+)